MVVSIFVLLIFFISIIAISLTNNQMSENHLNKNFESITESEDDFVVRSTSTDSDYEIKTLTTFSTNSNQLRLLSEPEAKTFGLLLPPETNITSATMKLRGKTPDTINKFKIGSRPMFISGDDFNNDGDLDFIITDMDEQKISIALGTGDLGFSTIQDFPTGDNPIWGTVNDFNNDGYPDVATANEGANTVTVHQNMKNQKNLLGNRKDYKIGDMPRSITSADFNSDGWIDIASISSNDNKLWIQYNNRMDALSFSDPLNITTRRSPTDITTGDVNNDGYIDILVINVGSNFTMGGKRFYDTVSIFKNDGKGNFTSTTEHIVGKKPARVITGDLNNDGLLDIATSNRVGNNLTVILNKDGSKFHSAINYSLVVQGKSGRSFRIGDVSGDGYQDLISLCSGTNTIGVVINNGDGTFKDYIDYTAGHSPTDLFLGDYDGDGDLDVTTANILDGTVSIISNNGDGTYATFEFYYVGGWPRGITNGDLDGDNDLEIITANYLGASLSIRYNDGNGYFPKRFDKPIAVEPFAVVIDDIDKDGHLDLISADEGLFELVIVFNDGDGNFVKRNKTSYGLGGYPYAILYHDLNDDGEKDLVTSNNGQQSISILWNEGNGTFAPFIDYSFPDKRPFGLAVGDVDGDFDDDLICTHLGFDTDPESSISIIWNNGNGTFTSHESYEVGLDPISIEAVDLDLDGDLDLAMANMISNSTTILMNLDNNSFGERRDYPVGPLPMKIRLVDLNDDGYLDIATANHRNDSVSIMYNKGDGTFTEQIEYIFGGEPTSVTIADFNNDGSLDFVSSNLLTSTITVRLDINYPKDISLDIGKTTNTNFEHNGQLSKTAPVKDFSDQLNKYLDSHGNDIIQTPFGDKIFVPIELKSKGVGALEFYDLDVKYSIIKDFDDDKIPDYVDTDDDNDQIPDDWEGAHDLNPLNNIDGESDLDNDNLTAFEEFQNSTDPKSADTDSDGLEDGFEIKEASTDPTDKDTDDDGHDDKLEIDSNTDPLDPKEFPKEKDEDQPSFIPSFGAIFILLALLIVIVLILRRTKKN